MKARKCSVLAGAVMCLGFLTVAPVPAGAANVTFFQFLAEPDGMAGAQKEFSYNAAGGLAAGPGSVGNGTFLSPGLIGIITGGMTGINASPPGVLTGPPYNILSDLTLKLTGFNAVGNATDNGTTIVQPLSNGTFTVAYLGPGGPIDLLIGSATSAEITAKQGTDNVGVLSGVVTYTGGLLYSQLAATGLSNIGGFSFAMTGRTGIYGRSLIGSELHLNSFDADATGSFDAGVAVPTPSTAIAGAVLIGAVVVGRKRVRLA